jgi:hypothetical protein
VVEQPDINKVECRFQAPRDSLVRLAGFGDPGRMIVGDNPYNRPMTSKNIHETAKDFDINVFQRPSKSGDIHENCGYLCGYSRVESESWL